MKLLSFIPLLSFTLFAFHLNAQEISVEIEPSIVEVGSIVNYTIDATNNGNDPIQIRSLPPFKAFEILARQSAPRMMNINGKVSRGLSVYIKLRAKKVGDHLLPPPILYFGRRPLKGEQKIIRVVKKGEAPTRKTKKYKSYFIEAKVLPTREVFVGEQLVLSYFLFSVGSSSSAEAPSEPELNDFWIEDLTPKNAGIPKMISMKGRVMNQTLLRKYALFPLKAGTLKIDPMKMSLNIGSMFRSRKIEISNEVTKVKILPLPPNAPENFYEGNVGQWELQVYPSTQKGKTGEPIQIHIRIKGVGQVGRLRLPELVNLPNSTLVKGEENSQRQIQSGTVYGLKEIEYSVIPSQIGTLIIPELTFSYFDPNKKEYITIQSDAIPLEIKKGKEVVAAPQNIRKIHPKENRSTHDIIDTLRKKLIWTHTKSHKTPATQVPIFIFLALIFPALLGLFWFAFSEKFLAFLSRRRDTKIPSNSDLLKEAIHSFENEEDILTIKRLLLKTLDLPPGASNARIKDALLNSGADRTNSKYLVMIFEKEERAKYSPGENLNIDTTAFRNAIKKIIPHLAVIIFIALSTFIPNSLFAEDLAEELVEEVAENLFNGEKEKASNPTYYFELSHRAIQKSNYGIARWALERSIYLDPTFDAAHHNLDLLNQIIRIQSIEASRRGVTLEGDEGIFWWKFFGKFSTIIWGSFWVLAWWFTFLMFFFRRKSSKRARRDTFFLLGVTSLVLALILSVGMMVRWQISKSVHPVVVIDPDFILKEGPSPQADSMTVPKTVVPGVILRVTDQRGAWKKIIFPDGKSGWLRGYPILFIEKPSFDHKF